MNAVRKECAIWRKNRIAARIILKGRRYELTARDIKLASQFSRDIEIADYLLDQAMGSLAVARKSHST